VSILLPTFIPVVEGTRLTVDSPAKLKKVLQRPFGEPPSVGIGDKIPLPGRTLEPKNGETPPDAVCSRPRWFKRNVFAKYAFSPGSSCFEITVTGSRIRRRKRRPSSSLSC
jgi:hypothetical protein